MPRPGFAALLWIISCALVATAGCAKITPEEVDKALTDHHNKNAYRDTIASFECRDGERDWEYICQARYEPIPDYPRAKRVVKKTVIQRIGLTHVVRVKDWEGKPTLGYGVSVLPDEGPIPSIEELRALRKREYEQVLKERGFTRKDAP